MSGYGERITLAIPFHSSLLLLRIRDRIAFVVEGQNSKLKDHLRSRQISQGGRGDIQERTPVIWPSLKKSAKEPDNNDDQVVQGNNTKRSKRRKTNSDSSQVDHDESSQDELFLTSRQLQSTDNQLASE